MLEFLTYSFFQNAVIGVAIISIAAAMIGTYIMARRLVAISGGITHACFGGLGLGYYLGISPIATAAIFAIGSALGVEWLSERHKVREDSAIAVVWSVGMAVGVLLVFMTPGFVPELNSFLFGNILTINRGDLIAFALYTIALGALFAWKFREIVACAFDADFARVSGLPVKRVNMAMTVMVALCIVLTIRLVGIMLLMSMISLPQMTAEIFVKRFKGIMILSAIISLACGLVGLALATQIDAPCSALIVAVMCGAYFVCRAARGIVRKKAKGGVA
ncbi:MAG: metal ABC transporter permease [[Clostridium] fimetarium]|nr:metal ABC transporter permease [Alistipes timonensis]MCM1405041.1 metal ABC transporter permease [[Clostridium] fimetarium]